MGRRGALRSARAAASVEKRSDKGVVLFSRANTPPPGRSRGRTGFSKPRRPDTETDGGRTPAVEGGLKPPVCDANVFANMNSSAVQHDVPDSSVTKVRYQQDRSRASSPEAFDCIQHSASQLPFLETAFVQVTVVLRRNLCTGLIVIDSVRNRAGIKGRSGWRNRRSGAALRFPDPEPVMNRPVAIAIVLVSALGLSACGTTIEQRAATGAVAGAVVGGPVGAAAGAAVGTAVGQAQKPD